MTKKTINTDKIANDLQGASSFFKDEVETPAPDTQTIEPARSGTLSSSEAETTTSRPVPPAQHAGYRDTVIPRHRDTGDMASKEQDRESILEKTRRAVRQLGRESATYRFTREEKDALADIIHEYRRSGIRTSENEITRIGLNYLLEDYRLKGQESVLAGVLELLNS